MGYMSEREFNSRMREIQLENKSKERKEKLKAEKNKFKRSKNKSNTSNKVLVSAIIAIIGYTIASLYIQYHTSVEVSSTLTTLWFSFWTVEIVVLAGIKVTKVFKGDSMPNDYSDVDD